jgi:cytochrome b6-f complex iron-sulfur subunit
MEELFLIKFNLNTTTKVPYLLLYIKFIIMERKDFIEQVGLSAASILIFGCMQGCSKSDSPAAPTPPPSNNNTTKAIDFTINITLNPYSSLNTAGGFYVDKTNNIIIARTLTNEFLAVSALCTHQQVLLDFQANNNRFYCSGHGSTFSTTGAVLNGPAATSLKQYKTTLAGNNLRIFE